MKSYVLIKRDGQTVKRNSPNFGSNNYYGLPCKKTFGAYDTSNCESILEKWLKKIFEKDPALFKELSQLVLREYSDVGLAEIENLLKRIYIILSSEDKTVKIVDDYKYFNGLITKSRPSFFEILKRRTFRKLIIEKIKDLDYYQIMNLSELVAQNSIEENMAIISKMGINVPLNMNVPSQEFLIGVLKSVIWKKASLPSNHLCINCENALPSKCRKVARKVSIAKYDFIMEGYQKIIVDGLSEKHHLEKFLVTKCLNFKKDR